MRSDYTDNRKQTNESILQIGKSPQQSGFLIEGNIKTIQKESKNRKTEKTNKKQKGGFFGMLLGLLVANVVANMFPGKAKILGRAVIRAGKGTIRAGLDI